MNCRTADPAYGTRVAQGLSVKIQGFPGCETDDVARSRREKDRCRERSSSVLLAKVLACPVYTPRKTCPSFSRIAVR